MPKFRFTEHEYARCVVDFEADNLEHAKSLIESVMSADDLPNSERYWKDGTTTWDDPLEVTEDNE